MQGRLAKSAQKRRARIDAAPPTGAPQATRRVLAKAESARAIVLVEGVSDQLAVEALAQRHGRDLDRERIVIVPMGGAQAIGRLLARFGPRGSGTTLAGLYDLGEEDVIRSGLERAGLGTSLTRADMERLGFYVCVEDLEDELIRSLGAEAVEQVLDAQGYLGSFRTFQKQPAWRGRPTEAQLRRFLGSSAGKARFAPLFVRALDLARMPRPLEAVLAHV
jgi:hypothetical protein